MAEETTTTQTDPKLTEQQQSDVVKEYESLITAKPKPAAPEKLPTGLRYPYSTVDNTQDFLKFTIFKYQRSGQITRDSNGLKADLLGNIILPVPAQLQDSNNANWGQSNMNFMEAGGVNAAKNIMGGNMEGTGNEIKNLVNQLKGCLLYTSPSPRDS